ncbi:YcxB family protein [Snuella lapsa]
MTKTKPYALSKNQYAKILIHKRFKNFWWLYAIMILLGLLNLKTFNESSFSSFVVIFSLAYPIVTFLFLYLWTHAKAHNPIFSTTNLLFDNEFIYFHVNKNETKLHHESIQKVVSNKIYWLLYVSKGQFVYIPKDIFYTQDDFNKFSVMINT